MSARPDLNLDAFFENIITSYESRIQKIQTAFQSSENITESSHSLFDNVHHSLNDLKKERDILNSRLCETLAKNGSLRKKDYNTMMSGILTALDEKEKEAESQFLTFIEDQKETAQSLKNSLLNIRDIRTEDAGEKISIIKERLAEVSKLQEIRKETVIRTFLDFQQMHNRMKECLEQLLEKGDHLMIQDIKKVKAQIIKDIN
ncbi:MAG: hypothetical protein WCK92_01165 [Bacteroidota bacterium]